VRVADRVQTELVRTLGPGHLAGAFVCLDFPAEPELSTGFHKYGRRIFHVTQSNAGMTKDDSSE
jgi:hypothetical protein